MNSKFPKRFARFLVGVGAVSLFLATPFSAHAAVVLFKSTAEIPSSIKETEQLKVTVRCAQAYSNNAPNPYVGAWVKARNSKGAVAYKGSSPYSAYQAYQEKTLPAGTGYVSYSFTLNPVNAKTGDKITITTRCIKIFLRGSDYNCSGHGLVKNDCYGDVSNQISKTITVLTNKTPEQIEADKRIAATVGALGKLRTELGTNNVVVGADSKIKYSEDGKTLTGLEFSQPEFGSIAYKEALTLSTSNFQDNVASVGAEAVKIGNGFIEIDSQSLPELNAPATVSLTKMTLVPDKQYTFLKDGAAAGDAVSNVTYSAEDTTLKFDVSGFSRYEVAAGLNVTSADNATTITGNITNLASDVDVVVKNGNGEKNETLQVNAAGEFSFTPELADGQNTIEIVATSASGVAETKTININRSGLAALLPWIIGAIALIAGVVGGVVIAKKIAGRKSAKKDMKPEHNLEDKAETKEVSPEETSTTHEHN